MTLLVLPPTFLLGAVAPFLVRLRVRRLEEVGRVSGSLSGVGTAGSLLGTFVPTLVTIPFLGTSATLRLLGALLILASALLLGRSALAALTLPLAVALAPSRTAAEPGVLAERDSAYQHIHVEERPGGTRLLLVNEGIAVQSSWTPGYRLSGTTYDAFLLLDTARDGGLRTLLDLGLAGGTIVHDYRTQRPDVAITGVEIDPVILELAERHFALAGRNLTVVEADARTFLVRTKRRFDALVVDVFRGPHVPFHCATREFFVLAKDRLEPGGAIMMNVAVLSARDRALTGLLNSVASVFAETWVWHPEGSSNWFILASDTSGLMARLSHNPVPDDMTELRREFVQEIRPVTLDPTRPVFTDDRSPIEIYSDLLFVRALTEMKRRTTMKTLKIPMAGFVAPAAFFLFAAPGAAAPAPPLRYTLELTNPMSADRNVRLAPGIYDVLFELSPAGMPHFTAIFSRGGTNVATAPAELKGAPAGTIVSDINNVAMNQWLRGSFEHKYFRRDGSIHHAQFEVRVKSARAFFDVVLRDAPDSGGSPKTPTPTPKPAPAKK